MHRKPHSQHSPEFKEQALLKARHRGTRSILSIFGGLQSLRLARNHQLQLVVV